MRLGDAGVGWKGLYHTGKGKMRLEDAAKGLGDDEKGLGDAGIGWKGRDDAGEGLENGGIG